MWCRVYNGPARVHTGTEEEEERGGRGVLWLVIGHSGPIGSGERPSISHGRGDKDVAHEDVVGRLNNDHWLPTTAEVCIYIPALTEIRANIYIHMSENAFLKNGIYTPCL